MGDQDPPPSGGSRHAEPANVPHRDRFCPQGREEKQGKSPAVLHHLHHYHHHQHNQHNHNNDKKNRYLNNTVV